MEFYPNGNSFDKISLSHQFMLPGLIYSSVQAMKNYRLSLAELRQLQTEKLRWMLKYCYDCIPLYHELFRGRGLTPEDIRATEDLRLLPTLSRARAR